jgi:hypothetical protein
MEFLLQQEGSLGTILLLVSLLVGLLYLLMPFFIWRIWFWSHQNSKHLKELNTKLELLIRDIAPDALPPIEAPEESPAEETDEQSATGEEESPADGTSEGDENVLPGAGLEGDLAEEDDMDFSISDEFEDVSDDLADSEISDFTDDEADEGFAGDLSDRATEESPADDSEEDELVMDFDDEEDETSEEMTEETPEEDEEDIFSESTEESEPESEADDRDFTFEKEENVAVAPSEIPVTETDPSDFTVEHFESNEEKSFEFEDVDDSSFDGPEDSFSEEELASDEAPEASTEAKDDWGESSTDDIWGDEAGLPSDTTGTPASQEDEEISFGDESDLGSAFDEPKAEAKDGNIGDVANSFLNDLEDKLNLDSFTEKSTTPPEPPPAPQPDPPKPTEPEPKPTESQSTLFARCEGCGHKLAYKQALSGKRVRCPACRTAFALP